MSAPRRPLSSRPAFLPDEISRREFATVFRGYDSSEVRTFLNQLGEQQAESSDLIAELQIALADAENQRHNPELDEETVTKILGEQTAQILRSAREVAADQRRRAEDEVSLQLREAHEVSTRMRQEAEAFHDERVEAAESQASTMVAEAAQSADRMRKSANDDIVSMRSKAELELEAMRKQAEDDAAAERERAQAEASELIEMARAEAKALVERTQERQTELLDGLVRKRKIALAQVEELRAGRQRLLEAYKMVRSTLDDVTDELSRVEGEARASAETAGLRSAQVNEIPAAALDEVIELEQFVMDDNVSEKVINLLENPASGSTGATGPAISGASATNKRHDDDDDNVVELMPMSDGSSSDGGSSGSGGAPRGSGDSALFDFASGTTLQREEIVVEVLDDDDYETLAETEQEIQQDAQRETRASAGLIIGDAFQSAGVGEMDRGLKLRRDAVIGKFRSQAVRRLKRSLQDEQDALVARLRSGQSESAQALLGSVEDQAATYQRSVVKLFREVARAGATSVEGSTGVERGVIDRTGTVVARGLALDLVQDLRQQLQPMLQDIIDSTHTIDSAQMQAYVSDPFDSIRGEYLDQLVDDRIGLSFDQGANSAQ